MLGAVNPGCVPSAMRAQALTPSLHAGGPVWPGAGGGGTGKPLKARRPASSASVSHKTQSPVGKRRKGFFSLSVGEVAYLLHIALMVHENDASMGGRNRFYLGREVEQVRATVAEHQHGPMASASEYRIDDLPASFGKNTRRDLRQGNRHPRLVVNATVHFYDTNLLLLGAHATEILVTVQHLEVLVPCEPDLLESLLEEGVEVGGAQSAHVAGVRELGEEKMRGVWGP